MYFVEAADSSDD